MTAAADRHLLFGLLALENGLIDQVQLVAAFQTGIRDQARSLPDHLQARGDLSANKRALLDALAEVHLERARRRRRDEPGRRSGQPLRSAGLAGLGEPEIEATLARVGGTTMARPPKWTMTPTAPALWRSAGRPALASGSARCAFMPAGGLGEVFVALLAAS